MPSQHTGPFVFERMTEAERIWNAYIDAWNTHRIDAILAAVDERFIYDERPMTMAAPLVGRAAFRKYLAGVFKTLPDLHIDTILCDTAVTVGVAESVMRGTYSARVPGLLRKGCISARVACVFEIARGRLVHERLYWDRANTMRQLGVVAAIASALTTRPVTFSSNDVHEQGSADEKARIIGGRPQDAPPDV